MSCLRPQPRDKLQPSKIIMRQIHLTPIQRPEMHLPYRLEKITEKFHGSMISEHCYWWWRGVSIYYLEGCLKFWYFCNGGSPYYMIPIIQSIMFYGYIKGSGKYLTDFGRNTSRYHRDQLMIRGRVWGEGFSAKRSPLEAEPLRVTTMLNA